VVIAIRTTERLGWSYIMLPSSSKPRFLVGPGQRVRYKAGSLRATHIICPMPSHSRDYLLVSGADSAFPNHQRANRAPLIKQTVGSSPTRIFYVWPGLRCSSWRTWIEAASKQVKDELGWADFRLTKYSSIERQEVFSALPG